MKFIFDITKLSIRRGSFSINQVDLITFDYQKRQSEAQKTAKRQLFVRMHPTIIDMALDAQYNYALLSKNSYHGLNSDKAKLLYYHFCLSSFPGGHAVTFSVDELLALWSEPAKTAKTKCIRRQELASLLDEMIEQITLSNIQDLSVKLVYDQKSRLESVIVKKHSIVPAPGVDLSRVTEDNKPLEGSCRVNSYAINHHNGHKTEIISVSCVKKVERDREGKIVRETDISQDIYQPARDFFASS